MKKKEAKGAAKRTITLDAAVYTRRGVEEAAADMKGSAAVRVLSGEGAIRVEFKGAPDTELEFKNLALLHTIEDKRG